MGTAALEGLICVQSGVTGVMSFSVSLASASSSVSTISAASAIFTASTTLAASVFFTVSTTSIGGVSGVMAFGGSPAPSSSPGRHAEG